MTVVPLTQTVIRPRSHMHSTRVHSPKGLSTSSFPRVSMTSLKSGSWSDHQSCRLVKTRGTPPFFHRGRLSAPSTVSAVSETGTTEPSLSLPRITIRSPTHPWASWHSMQDIHVPPAPPSGPTACRRTPELRTDPLPSVL